MQHTPGPWSLWGKAAPSQVIAADGVFVAQTLGGNDEANARLISVAPDLLAALRHAVAVLAWLCENPHSGLDAEESYGIVSAAIAKAAGLTEG